MKNQGIRLWINVIGVGMAVCLMLTGCGNRLDDGMENPDDHSSDRIEDVRDTISDLSAPNTADSNILEPSDLSGYRKISDELPEAGAEVALPGTREHFTFTDEGRTYLFTETETLWLYNQSMIGELHTEFMLDVKGNKVTLIPLSAEDKTKVQLSQYQNVYEDDAVTIYRGRSMTAGSDDDYGDGQPGNGTTKVGLSNDNGSSIPEDAEPMYLALYDLEYKVDGWQMLVSQGTVAADTLYQELAQMGTAIEPVGADGMISNVLEGYRSRPVFGDYCFAYRQGITHTGFFYCSPNTNQADYDSVSVYMSVYLPDWDAYAILHIEPSPAHIDSLENTGEQYDGNPILADYAGSLKYYLIGEDGRCAYLEGIPGEAGSSDKAYTAKEAAYIYELVFTK